MQQQQPSEIEKQPSVRFVRVDGLRCVI
jgi:hypothetical protein